MQNAKRCQEILWFGVLLRKIDNKSTFLLSSGSYSCMYFLLLSFSKKWQGFFFHIQFVFIYQCGSGQLKDQSNVLLLYNNLLLEIIICYRSK